MPTMTRLVPASITLLAALVFAPDASAKAYYAPLSEAEARIDAVAIVQTAGVADADIEGEHWRYRQLIQGDVVDPIAGTLQRRIEILGARTFICAPVAWDDRTQYLALLEREGDRWTATNNEWGRLEIVGGKVAWPYDESDEMVPVDEIIAMLEARLEARLGPGRYADEAVEPAHELEAEVVVATPPVVETEAAPVEERSPAPWIAVGAVAVALGFFAGTRRPR